MFCKINLVVVNVNREGVDYTPYLGFFLVKLLLLDISTIPFVRIREILLAIKISNKIWRFFWVRGVAGGA